MRGIIACEESQTVTKAFNELDHDFMSLDILPCSGGQPHKHIQNDVFHELTGTVVLKLNFLGSHPPCTYLANSGVRWLYNKDGSKNEERWERMRMAALFFRSLLRITETIGKGYLENPIMHKHAMEIIGVKPDQIIQPWQFGHGEQKATCLWLVGVPKLIATDIVEGREQRIWKLPPSEDRAKLRSKTFPGIAKAMADQWG